MSGRKVYNAAYAEARRRYFARLLASGYEAIPCALCPRLVDLRRTGSEPLSRSIHHLIPLSIGGSLLDETAWRVAHVGCNSRQGKRLPIQRYRPDPAPSREW